MRIGSVVVAQAANSRRLSERKLFERRCMIEVVLRGCGDAVVAETLRNRKRLEIRAVIARKAIDGRGMCGGGLQAAGRRAKARRYAHRVVVKHRVRAFLIAA